MKRTKGAVLLTAGLMLCLTLSGCGAARKKDLPDDEVVVNFLTAYQQGDYESLKQYISADNQLNSVFSTLENGDSEGMGAVYRQMHELTKGLTFTAEIVEGRERWGEVLVHVQTNSVIDNISGAMSAAIEDQAENGGSSFRDLPSWLLEGLQTGDKIDEEITVHVGNRDGNNVMDTNTNREFFRQITGGFYDYIDTTMTTCTDEGVEYDIASRGDDIIGMVETAEQTEGVDNLTEEDIRQFESSYDVIGGVVARVQQRDDGVYVGIGVNFDEASSLALKNLGIISDRITASGGYISLSSTISSFENDGMTCTTDTFGAAGISEK